MAKDPEVTVSVNVSLEGLKKGLQDGKSLLEQFAGINTSQALMVSVEKSIKETTTSESFRSVNTAATNTTTNVTENLVKSVTDVETGAGQSVTGSQPATEIIKVKDLLTRIFTILPTLGSDEQIIEVLRSVRNELDQNLGVEESGVGTGSSELAEELRDAIAIVERELGKLIAKQEDMLGLMAKSEEAVTPDSQGNPELADLADAIRSMVAGKGIPNGAEAKVDLGNGPEMAVKQDGEWFAKSDPDFKVAFDDEGLGDLRVKVDEVPTLSFIPPENPDADQVTSNEKPLAEALQVLAPSSLVNPFENTDPFAIADPQEAAVNRQIGDAIKTLDFSTLKGKTDTELLATLRELVKAQAVQETGDLGFAEEVAAGIDGLGPKFLANIKEALAGLELTNPARPEPRIIDDAAERAKQKAAEPIALPEYSNQEIQAQRLVELTQKWAAERRKIASESDGNEADRIRYEKLTVALKAAKEQMEALQAAGVRIKPVDKVNDPVIAPMVGMEMPNILGDDNAQYEALTVYDDALNKVMEQLELSGQAGSSFGMALQERIAYVAAELEALEVRLAANNKSSNNGQIVDAVAAIKLPPVLVPVDLDRATFDAQLNAALSKAQAQLDARLNRAANLKTRANRAEASGSTDLADDLRNQAGSLETSAVDSFTAANDRAFEAFRRRTSQPDNSGSGILETAEAANQLATAAGISTGKVGNLISGAGRLSSVAGSATPVIVGLGAALGAVTAGAVVLGITIKTTLDIFEDAIRKAGEFELKMVGLSTVLGGKVKAQVVVEEIEMITRNTGVDPQALRSIIPELEAKGRGALSSGEGLELIVDVAAKLDPTKVAEYGSAIAGAFEAFRTQDGSLTGTLNGLVQMGMISGDTARQLEILNPLISRGELWQKLGEAMLQSGDDADNANEKFGALWGRFKTDISSTWDVAMKSIGTKFTEAAAPALVKLLDSLDKMKPMLNGIISYAGNVMRAVGEWLSGVVSGTVRLAVTMKNMFMSGDIKEFVAASMSWGLMSALNAFINGLAYGIQFSTEMFKAPFKLLASGDFWSGIGSALKAAGYGLISVLAGLGATLFGALAPVFDWVGAVFDTIIQKLAAGMLKAVSMLPAALLGGNESKQALTIAADNLPDYSVADNFGFRQKEREADDGGILGKLKTGAAEIAGAAAKKAMVEGITATGKMVGALKTAAPDTSNFYKPDFLQGAVDSLGQDISRILNKNAPKEGEEKETEIEKEKAKVPELKNVQASGAKVVTDSLQAVGGGGGFYAGVSIAERQLEEAKRQTAELQKLNGKDSTLTPKVDIASMFNQEPVVRPTDTLSEEKLSGKGGALPSTTAGISLQTFASTPFSPKTDNLSGAFGSGNGKEGNLSTALLSSINSTLISMLNAMRSGGGGSRPSGSLVSIRG